MERMPEELRKCRQMGGDTTLMVWADLDHDMSDGEELKTAFWTVAEKRGVSEEEFDTVVFVFAKDRIENWIEFLLTGRTDESTEGPRQKHGRAVSEAARELARRCHSGTTDPGMPPSLVWSCRNWRRFVDRLNT